MSRGAADPYAAYLRAFFARWSAFYDLFAAPIGFVYRAAARQAGAAPGRRLLDLCTGTGELALRCVRLGAEVTAVDFTASMLSRARAKARGGGLRLLEADARRLPFADSSFDVALLSFALHDMPARARVESLREAARVARESVIVVDYDPAASGFGRRLVISMLARFETAYLRGFLRAGGAPAAIAAAELAVERRRRALPGLFGIWSVAAAGQPSRRRISASSTPGSSSASS